jgi:hypothetical protein
MNKANLDDLIDTWWKTAEVMGISSDEWVAKKEWHAHVFETILRYCGWTVSEWNEAMNKIEEDKK